MTIKRKPQKLDRNTQKSQKINEKVFLSVLGKTAPDYKVKEFLKEWQ